MPLWKNPLIATDSLFMNDWYCKVIRTVGDITDDEFNILNLDSLVQKLKGKCIDFLTFHRIKSGAAAILAPFQNLDSISYNQPYLPLNLGCILKDEKGVKTI